MVMVKRIGIAACGALLLGGCLVPKDQYEALRRSSDEKAAAWEENAAQYEKRLAELKAEVDAGTQKQTELQQKIADLETRLTDQEAEKRLLHEEKGQLLALNEELSKNKKQLEQAKAELEKRSAEYEGLAKSLQTEIQSGKIELSELKGRMTVKMKDKILFSSGSAKIGKEGEAALDKVAEALKDVKGKIIRVEGHTDSDPVDPKGPFASNWELSVARAMAVVAHLQAKGVDPTKLSVAGYGHYQPIAPNRTAEQKSRNRRIEIVLATDPNATPVVATPKTARRE